ncbi:MAG: hypothetical protein KOO61_03770 [Spirochaetales bacterium]|nr:hypothetical protein [Spirochaetales bacterium]
MSAEHQKATAFVTRLLANPALKSLTPLQREEQIIQFLHANATQLAPTLATPAFFPGASWNQIVALLLGALMDYVNTELFSSLDEIGGGQIDFAYVNFLRQQSVGSDKVQQQAVSLVKTLLAKPEARREFTGAHTALVFKFVDRYLDAVWTRKSYIHFEITKVQRLRMSKEQVKAMIETTLLLKPVVYLVATGGVAGQAEQTSGIVETKFGEKVFLATKKHLNLVPDPVLKSAVSANISFIENRFIEATARIAAIFSARCRNFQPSVRVDRGADSPDKSWLSIARRNYKFYGFDIKMLDEFFSIAAENGW